MLYRLHVTSDSSVWQGKTQSITAVPVVPVSKKSIFTDYFYGFKENILAMKTVIRPVGLCETGRNETHPLSAPDPDSWPQI